VDCVRIECFGCDEADVEEKKLSFNAKILLGALVLVVVVYISTVSYTVLGSDSDKPVAGQMDIFNPITLRTIGPVAGNISEMPLSGNVITLPSIRIPVRPAMRSPFQPLWASDRQTGTGK
jgi:hypothetical protein